MDSNADEGAGFFSRWSGKISSMLNIFSGKSGQDQTPADRSQIVLDSENFADVVKSAAYRDKTGFIKFFVNNGYSYMVIHGPTGFGKSVNMNMVKEFLEAEFEPSGKFIEPKATKKYRLFTENNLEVGRETDLFKNYFAQYPVIYFNFKVLDVRSFEAFLDSFRRMVSKEFKRHDYLRNALNGSNLRDYHRHSDPVECKQLHRMEFVASGQTLAMLLESHHGKRCYLLVDDFDTPLKGVLLEKSLRKEEVDKIIDFLVHFLANMIKAGAVNSVARSFLTGNIRFGDFQEMNNLYNFMILDYENVAKYYGFTSKDVQDLAKKFKEENIKELQDRYNGFQILGKDEETLYPPVPFLEYFKYKRMPENGDPPGKELHSLFKYDKFGSFFEETIDSGVSINLLKELQKEDFLKLRNLLEGKANTKNYDEGDLNLALNFFFDNGLYTYEKWSQWHSRGYISVKVTNLAIRNSLEKAIITKEYLCQKYNIQKNETRAYLESILNLTPEMDRMMALKVSIETILKKLKPGKKLEMVRALFGFIRTQEVYYVDYSRSDLKGDNQPDMTVVKDHKTGVVIKFKFHKSVDEAWSELKERNYFGAFNKAPLNNFNLKYKGCLGINYSDKGVISIKYVWDTDPSTAEPSSV